MSPTTGTPNPSSADRDPTQLRSHRWFGPDDLRSFGHRSRLKGMGFDDVDYENRPIVAMLNTWNEMTHVTRTSVIEPTKFAVEFCKPAGFHSKSP